jgi:hypothetical protein
LVIEGRTPEHGNGGAKIWQGARPAPSEDGETFLSPGLHWPQADVASASHAGDFGLNSWRSALRIESGWLKG